ncbi:GNAT family N-acetyltransferase [Shewanella sp. Isolate8]|uniref:GNAT family N-acetyltransferase n=1 Tax=Shewanella sp. Isolate8 TaxID=2908529 RepID=UPI001EFEEE99|nr:GNAT family N-acetyltransferase [Shewanella sp. Isolate8]MCG9746672.1 GNAT family N-acetyltransferase [Shewanella sp. Isolate8]
MGETNPFSRYGFLHALELSGCVGEQTGWRPLHLVVSEVQFESSDERNDSLDERSDSRLAPNKILAVMPLYLKSHSYGEYVFDWAWAQAYERHGCDYYPKLVNVIPFTPVTGPRIGLREGLSDALKARLIGALGEYLDQFAKTCSASSWHSLFLAENERITLTKQGHLERLGTQFHWFNKGYRSFDDFLSRLTSRRRKSILKERRTLANAGLRFRFIEGPDITAAELNHFVHCYQRTYYKRSGHQGYLNAAFFDALVEKMPGCVRLLMVERVAHNTSLDEQHQDNCQQADSQLEGAVVKVAAALYLVGQECLYGRYWGTLEEIAGLHFEACYYQGIEYAIAKGFNKFDAGAQGEHKVLRGFEPVTTYSVHEILHSDFRRAIADFIEQEAQAVKIYMSELEAILPFRRR